MTDSKDAYWMAKALELAHTAELQGEVPVGAVLVKEDRIIGQGFNQPIKTNDPSHHAEMEAIRSGGQNIGNYRLLDTTLYVTLEPCIMCAGLLVHARIKRLVFGAYDEKAGGVVSVAKVLDIPKLNHRVLYEGGIMQAPCSNLLKDFFRNRREIS